MMLTGSRPPEKAVGRPLLRQYLPTKSDLSVYAQHDLDAIAHKLNSRLRETLDYSTPADTLAATVALTS